MSDNKTYPIICDTETQQAHTFETVYEIWNDDTGERISVGPDRDGLDLIEIRMHDTNKGEVHTQLSFTKPQARMLVKALELTLGEGA